MEGNAPPAFTYAYSNGGTSSDGIDFDSGGAYAVTYTPTLAGAYTVAVLLATTREVQVVTTTFGSPEKRSGTWTLRIHQACSPVSPPVCPCSHSVFQVGRGVATGSGAADSLHRSETALFETTPLQVTPPSRVVSF